MKLEIRLFAGLECKNPKIPCNGQREFYLDVSEGTTLLELLQLLGLDSEHLIYLINGLAQNIDWVLHDNDRVGIFPPVGGG